MQEDVEAAERPEQRFRSPCHTAQLHVTLIEIARKNSLQKESQEETAD
jgi:hypothetical protein